MNLEPGGTSTTCAGIAPVSPRPASLYHTPGGPKGRGRTVRRSAWMLFAGILASFPLSSTTYYVLELRGGSHIYATAPPVRKGRLTLFHRYPDGIYMSVSSPELVRVETATEPPPSTEKFAPGD